MGDANSIYLSDTIKKIGGWPEESINFQDWAMWFKLLSLGYQTEVVPEILYYYRIHPEADSSNQIMLWIDNNNIKLITKILQNNPEQLPHWYILLHRMIRNLKPSSYWGTRFTPPSFKELSPFDDTTFFQNLGVIFGQLSSR
jgi:hypothetical protein